MACVFTLCPPSPPKGCVRLFVCLINNCWPVYDVCALLFFNICVSSVSCTAVPLCLLPAEMSGWSWLLVQRAPPAANEVKLHVHAPRSAMCLHACRTWGLVSELCLPIRPVSVRPAASCECSFAIWITAASHWLACWLAGAEEPGACGWRSRLYLSLLLPQVTRPTTTSSEIFLTWRPTTRRSSNAAVQTPKCNAGSSCKNNPNRHKETCNKYPTPRYSPHWLPATCSGHRSAGVDFRRGQTPCNSEFFVRTSPTGKIVPDWSLMEAAGGVCVCSTG